MAVCRTPRPTLINLNLIPCPVIYWGLGRHASDLPPENLVMVLKVESSPRLTASIFF